MIPLMCKYFVLTHNKKERKRRGVETNMLTLHKKRSFPLRIYSVTVIKSAVFKQCQVFKIPTIVARLLMNSKVNNAWKSCSTKRLLVQWTWFKKCTDEKLWKREKLYLFNCNWSWTCLYKCLPPEVFYRRRPASLLKIGYHSSCLLLNIFQKSYSKDYFQTTAWCLSLQSVSKKF